MSGTARHSGISGRRFALIVLVGPFVGLLGYIAAILVTDPPVDGFADFLPLAALIVFLGWPIGALPALLAATVWRMLPRPSGIWPRTGLAAVVGAVAAVVGVSGAVFVLGLEFPPRPIYAAIAVCGALALVATAIPMSSKGET